MADSNSVPPIRALLRVLALAPGAAGLYASAVAARVLWDLDGSTTAFIQSAGDPDFAADYGLFYAALFLGALFLAAIGLWAAVLAAGMARGCLWARRFWPDLTIVSFLVGPPWLFWRSVSHTASLSVVITYAVVLGSLLVVALWLRRATHLGTVPP